MEPKGKGEDGGNRNEHFKPSPKQGFHGEHRGGETVCRRGFLPLVIDSQGI
jgi:hypothetical protein